jgi:hypothetical protein
MGKGRVPWRPQLSLQEFEASYAHVKGRPWDELDVIAVPCVCGTCGCPGWAAWPRRALLLVATTEDWDALSIARVLKCPDPRMVREIIQLLEA